ncbi:MAG: amidohydrolase [Oscillospiraceae bacterium]|nr:amidohydrolase [Oscillospiraceae bacterium]
MIFKEPALNIKDKLVEFRRDFHMHPEASFCEERTNAVIRKFLEDNGIEIQEVGAGYSVVGVIRGGKPGKTFALRADIDALPMPELNDVPYKSQNEGVMHACGHDAHTASLMGVALLINEVKDQMNGNVKLLFQAAEEKIPGGAKELVEKGALENPYVDAVMGFHVANALPVGYVAFGAGPGAAASDTYKFRIIGKGGHGAYPHATIDPVVISAYFITSLQTIVSRNVEPVQGAVITIGSIHGGTKENIIADDVEMLATVRSLDEDVRALLHKRIQEICKATEAMYGCKVEWELEMGYPVLVNDGDFINKYALPSCAKIVGADHIIEVKKSGMGGEDFAYYLQQRPGCFGSLGSGNAEKGLVVGGHNSMFDLDEDCLWRGAACLAQTAWDYLEENK